MCGIAGIAGLIDFQRMRSALSALSHRGPDARHQRTDYVGRTVVSLGHARLSILDLTSAADQPFASPDGRYVVVFNGEIFNHLELRSQLAAKGARFRSRSDTEVLLAAYGAHGAGALEKLEGMFAFAILDRERQEIFAARDPFGIKPFYYSIGTDRFAFASEIPALESLCQRKFRPDRGALAEFLLNGFIYEPGTGRCDVRKLPPGGWLCLHLPSLSVEVGTYCSPLEQEQGNADDLAAHLERAMALQVEADVPVGIFFSGGIDSSLLLSASPRPIDAILVDFSREGAHADRAIAVQVAQKLGAELRVVEHAPAAEGRADSVLEEFSMVARGPDEPISDFTFAASSLISRCARDRGFKVMISGMGGDELFGGYPRYIAARYWSSLRRVSPLVGACVRGLRVMPAWARKADRLLEFSRADDFLSAYTQLVGYFSVAEVDALVGRRGAADISLNRLAVIDAAAAGRSWQQRAMHLDRYGYLPHNLCVADKSSMAHGLEVRVPFLTRPIARWAMGQSDRALVERGVGKLPLRRLLSARLPRGVTNRPKVGFNPPLDRKIDVIGEINLRDLLTGGSLAGLLDTDLIGRWIGEHFAHQRDHTYRLWQLCYLRLWLDANAA